MKNLWKTRIGTALPALVLLAVAGLTGCPNGTTDSDTGAPAVYSADVIVVGAGGAGMTAAIHAAQGGASVIILEKASVVGGNTLLTGSGMRALKTDDDADIQAFINEEDMASTMGGGVYKNPLPNKNLVEFLVKNSLATLNWLKTLGMSFAAPSNGRTYATANGANFAQTAIPLLYKDIVSKDVNILFNMRATSLITEGGKVTGVKATDAKGNELTFKSNAVVLTTGGVGQNYAMVADVKPEYKDFFTTAEIAPTTGDGLVMAQAIGADVVDLDQIQLNQVVELTSHANINYGTRNSASTSFIFVNKDAQRFTDEKTQGSQVALDGSGFPKAVMDQPDHYAYFIFDQAAMNSAATLQDYYNRGLITLGFTVRDLAKKLRIDEDAFEATVNEWNRVVADVANNPTDEFGRSLTRGAYPLSTPPYYGVKFSVGVHYCMGGLKINTDTQVIDTSDKAIPGLYAAGEVTGGVHGSYRIDGTALADTLIFGRQAGTQAAVYALAQGRFPVKVPSDDGSQGPAAQGNFTDGVYTGTGQGRNGAITLQVTVENKSITKIEVLLNDETPTIFVGVENKLIPAIIRTQGVKVDVVTGATYSSNGVLDAVANALGISR
jgi:fumarate reductase flavoprotein subunit